MRSRMGLFIVAAAAIMVTTTVSSAAELGDAEIDNLVRRSYQYVAMYNVNNKFALKQGGWNTVDADTQLKDLSLIHI